MLLGGISGWMNNHLFHPAFKAGVITVGRWWGAHGWQGFQMAVFVSPCLQWQTRKFPLECSSFLLNWPNREWGVLASHHCSSRSVRYSGNSVVKGAFVSSLLENRISSFPSDDSSCRRTWQNVGSTTVTSTDNLQYLFSAALQNTALIYTLNC